MRKLLLLLLLFSCRKENHLENSPWVHKRFTLIGDSYTATASYFEPLQQRLDPLITNLGENSTTVTSGYKRTGLSFFDRRHKVKETNPDLVVIFSSVNDAFGNNSGGPVPLGNIDSHDSSTFYGALKAVVQTIKTDCPGAVLLLVAPNAVRDSSSSTVQKTFNKAVIEVGNLYDVPLLDLFNGSPLDFDNLWEYLKVDRVHLNAEGGKIVGNLLVDKIITL